MRVILKPGGLIMLAIVGLLAGLFMKFRPQPGPSTPASPTTLSPVTTVDIARLCNVEGITADGDKTKTKGIDGIDATFSAALLKSPLRYDGVPFVIGAAKTRNVIIAGGQQITLPEGRFSKLRMLATAAGKGTSPASVPFNVSYTDGSTTPFTQGISDWFSPQNYPGETKAVTMAYRNRTGVKDPRTFYLYGYSFQLDSTKTVKSFILPNDPEVKVISITLTP